MELFGVDIPINFELLLGKVIKLAILIVAFSIAVPLGKKMISATINKMSLTRKTKPGRIKTLDKLLLNIFSYMMIFIFIGTMLSIFGVNIGPLIAGAGVLGLAIGFGAQGLVSDVVTGFFILLEQQMEVDDYVTVAGIDGIVEEIGLRTTKVRAFDGTLNYLPNRIIENVANHTRGNMRALVDIGISYSNDVDQAISVLERVCEVFQSDERFKDGPNAIGVQSIDRTDVILRVIGQVENGLQWECERDLLKAIKTAFDAANIELPLNYQVIQEQPQIG
ncbi:mechanosensitive ion channel family protein [Sporosarcina aquimarina]|uniref:Mechanosensitive ion channel family protein n=1 Tax=Sporosarcina aquimarina TaxID=114975 RepID=A0ABU4G0U5_9BACL|nr:mechanosensitive ion channel family protein [Sporosarcina aquimarina]MDW0110027.1 mechanosensitive ion channel family protein [Sporosarcina aquimarina]